ncbi:MAG: DUF547 domain-containing protein [Gammaproteobacteria bacterium]|jgi:hypothetical protein|nr:MAG: DUF547 domain-containing protein [Gammaproteobacteria bacterium]
MRSRALKPSSFLATLVFALLSYSATAIAVPKAELWTFWLDHVPDSTVELDHSAWQRFLDSYLTQHEDGINRVDYGSVTAQMRSQLQAYLDYLTASDPRLLSRDEQLAYWVNLYNALTVEVVLRHPGKGSILRMRYGLLSIGPWAEPLIEIAGNELSLNDIEHRILRPIWQDHRIHYVVNCASLGCPNLNRLAYNSENVSSLLAAAEVEFVNHPRGVTFTDDGRLRLSSIFKWYRGDFATSQRELLDHLARRHATLGDAIRNHRKGIQYKYDWNLNRP